ncbi:hypothetical protein CBR_g39203, partial [Chara braunii]
PEMLGVVMERSSSRNKIQGTWSDRGSDIADDRSYQQISPDRRVDIRLSRAPSLSDTSAAGAVAAVADEISEPTSGRQENHTFDMQLSSGSESDEKAVLKDVEVVSKQRLSAESEVPEVVKVEDDTSSKRDGGTGNAVENGGFRRIDREVSPQVQDVRAGRAMSRENGSVSDGGREPEVSRGGLERGLSITAGSLGSMNGPPKDEVAAAREHRLHQDLDEARGLLRSAASVGQSKEARLARVCERLQARVQELKAENAQLEEMLHTQNDKSGSAHEKVRQLEQELMSRRSALVAMEMEISRAIEEKNAEIQSMAVALEAAKKQATAAEGKLAVMQISTESAVRDRELSEARIQQALREQLVAAERRAEDEREAHAATRQAAGQREAELEARVTEGAAALTKMQRLVDERNEKMATLEHKISMLEVECATLNQELQDADSKLRREQKKVEASEKNQASQVDVLIEESGKARRAQREAEAKLSTMEAETEKLRNELAKARREAGSSSVQAHAELERRFRELTELLYLKQTQLEALSSEKAALLLKLEKEARRAREAKAQVERDQSIRRHMLLDDDEADMKMFEFSANRFSGVRPGIRTAAKYLDFGAVSAGKFLWRRPQARLGVLFYLLQEKADMSLTVALKAAEAASGLVKP